MSIDLLGSKSGSRARPFRNIGQCIRPLRNNGSGQNTRIHPVLKLYLVARSGPYGEEETTITEIIRRVREDPAGGVPMRPNIELLRDVSTDMDTELPEYVVTLMQECWAEDVEIRYLYVTRVY